MKIHRPTPGRLDYELGNFKVHIDNSSLAVLKVPANWKIPTNLPRSWGREISAMTPVPRAIVADPPAACFVNIVLQECGSLT